MKAFDRNDFFFASKKFSEAELNFDKIELALNHQLCLAFVFIVSAFIMKQLII